MVFTVNLRKLYFFSFFFFSSQERQSCLFVGVFFLSQAEIYLQIEHLPLLSSHGIGVALLPELQERVDSAPRDAQGGIVGAGAGPGLGLGDLCGSLPAQGVPWFCGSILHF